MVGDKKVKAEAGTEKGCDVVVAAPENIGIAETLTAFCVGASGRQGQRRDQTGEMRTVRE